jgi:DNA-directed RNA polymerase subunit L/DNA-directed RNA polymerase alpha subunit
MEASGKNNVFTNYKKDGREISFVYSTSASHKASYPYANTLIRLIMAHVPTVAFRADMTEKGTTSDVEITANTTPMTNEMASHRIGLIPLHVTDVDAWEKDGASYEFVCSVENSAPETRHVTTQDIRVFRLTDDGERIPVEEGAFFKPFEAGGYREYILLASLKGKVGGSLGKTEQFGFKARASVGIGKSHARYIPTSRATYAYTQETDETKINDAFFEWAEMTKKIDRATLDQDAEKKDKLMREFKTMAIQRCYLKDADGEPYSFDMVLETVGVLEPEVIFQRALKAGEQLVHSYSGPMLPDNVRVEPAGARIFAYDFIFRGEDHTLGNLITTWIDDNLYGKGVVNYVGYDIPHPLDDMMVIRIGVSDNSEESARSAFRQAAAGCEAMFKTFGDQWTSVAVSAQASVLTQAQPVKKIIKRVITRPQPEQAL